MVESREQKAASTSSKASVLSEPHLASSAHIWEGSWHRGRGKRLSRHRLAPSFFLRPELLFHIHTPGGKTMGGGG